MRAQKRRMPAERVRHAKRLGHVQQGSGPAFLPVNPPGNPPGKPTTTTSTQTEGTTTAPTQTTLPTVIPVTQSSSASASTPSSSAATSPTTPLTSSVASTTNGQSTTATTMSISSLTSQGSTMPTLATSTTPSSLATATPSTNVAAAKSNGLSGGAIAGIIAGAVVVGVALIMFFVRKTALRRQQRKRISWSGAPGVTGGVFAEPQLPELSEKPAYLSAVRGSQGGNPVSPFEPHGQSMYTTPPPPVVRIQTPTIPTYAPPAPPQATFNNPAQVGRYPAFSPGNTAVAGATPLDATVRGPQAPVETTVRCTYVPSLPDELSITTGERIHVVARYDDGWALCANARGEQGMVPQECLDAPSSVDWGNGRRLSSLNADGRSY